MYCYILVILYGVPYRYIQYIKCMYSIRSTEYVGGNNPLMVDCSALNGMIE